MEALKESDSVSSRKQQFSRFLYDILLISQQLFDNYRSSRLFTLVQCTYNHWMSKSLYFSSQSQTSSEESQLLDQPLQFRLPDIILSAILKSKLVKIILKSSGNCLVEQRTEDPDTFLYQACASSKDCKKCTKDCNNSAFLNSITFQNTDTRLYLEKDWSCALASPFQF